MPLLESGEMYLETLYILSQKSDAVRSLDVALYMNYSKPSVSRAIGLLKKDGLVEADCNGFLSLTSKGSEIAGSIYERHTILSQFFIKIGVPTDTAVADACKIEHVISKATFAALKKHIEKIP